MSEIETERERRVKCGGTKEKCQLGCPLFSVGAIFFFLAWTWPLTLPLPLALALSLCLLLLLVHMPQVIQMEENCRIELPFLAKIVCFL